MEKVNEMGDLELKLKELKAFEGNKHGIVGMSVEYISEIYNLLLEYKNLKEKMADDGK